MSRSAGSAQPCPCEVGVPQGNCSSKLLRVAATNGPQQGILPTVTVTNGPQCILPSVTVSNGPQGIPRRGLSVIDLPIRRAWRADRGSEAPAP